MYRTLIVLGLLSYSSSSFAEDIKRNQVILPYFIDSAAIGTDIGFHQTVSIISVDMPTWPNYRAVSFAEGLDLGVQVYDSVGLTGKINAGFLSGLDRQKDFYFSVGALFRYDAGVAVKVLGIPHLKTQITSITKIKGSNSNSGNLDTSLLTIDPWAVTVLKTTDDPVGTVEEGINDPTTKTKSSSFYIGDSLNMINKFSQNFIIQSSLGFFRGTKTQDNSSKDVWQAMAGAAVSIGAAPALPVVFQSEYSYTRESDNHISHSVLESFFYGLGVNTQAGFGAGKTFVADQNIWMFDLTARHIF